MVKPLSTDQPFSALLEDVISYESGIDEEKLPHQFPKELLMDGGNEQLHQAALPLGGGVAGDAENKKAPPVPVTSEAVLFWGCRVF